MALRYNIKQAVDKPKGTRVLVPMIQPSLAFEKAYLKELRKLLHGAAGGVRDIIIPSYERKREVNRLTGDADEDAFTAFTNLLKSLARIATTQLSTLLGLEGKRHTEQWLSTVKKTFSIDLKGIVDAEGLTNYLEAAALRNASLITGMTDDLIKRVQQDTINALVGGESVATLKEKIKHSLNVSDNRAKLIAYDQTSKLNADLNKKRHQEAGIDSYIWRTSHDERVRPRHRALEGTQYKYDEPTGAEDGLPPGQPIRCRCIAQAVVEFGDDEQPRAKKVQEMAATPVVEVHKAQLSGPAKKVMSQSQKEALAKAHAASKAKGEATKAAKAAEAAHKKAMKQVAAEAAAAVKAAAKKAEAEAKAAAKAALVEAKAAAKAAEAAKKLVEKERAAAIKAAQKVAAKQVPPYPPFRPTTKDYDQFSSEFPVVATPGNGKDSLESYVGSGYRGMNSYYRSGGKEYGDYRDRSLALKAAIERSAIPVDIKTYRGVGSIRDMVPGTDDVSKLLGATIEDRGFVSVATDSQVSEGFAMGNNRNPPPPPLMMEVRLRAGQKGLHVGRNGIRYAETEIILPPGTKFRVIEVEPAGYHSGRYGSKMDKIVLEII